MNVPRDVLQRVWEVLDDVFNGEQVNSSQLDQAHDELWRLLWGKEGAA